VKPIKPEFLAIILLAVAGQASSTTTDYLDAAFIPGLQAHVRRRMMEQITLAQPEVFAGRLCWRFCFKTYQGPPHALTDLALQIRTHVFPAVYTFLGGAICFFTVDWSLGLLFLGGIVLFT
jgi:ABC-type multidrug transport system fused ATPase/permease subunit